ncbi:MAG: hypothetical protein CVT94_00850 [Bacteroidetes bacterium HGW-Bacteroidetes-11]|jgi:hypothetical protein|nr:MAG: hypothetical protein CVT94_00850 [Bacteroidetes bacterium HGW-Bacteroidetes-11]
MIIGNPIIIQCPVCNTNYTKNSILSGNTFGGYFWSDGSFFAPMLPDQVVFNRCTECNTIFNISNAPNHEAWNYEDADGLTTVEHLSKSELFEAIEKYIYINTNEEIYLRKRLWQKLNNHPWKDEMPSTFAISPEYRQNAEALINLLDKSNEDEILIIAELHRNIGNFKDCTDLINTLSDARREERTVQIENACKKKINGTLQYK